MLSEIQHAACMDGEGEGRVLPHSHVKLAEVMNFLKKAMKSLNSPTEAT